MRSKDENELLARALEGYPDTFGAEPSSAPPVPSPESPPWFRQLKPWLGIAVPVLFFLVRVVFSPTSFPVYELTAVDVQYAPLGAGTVATPGSAIDLSLRPRTAVAVYGGR